MNLMEASDYWHDAFGSGAPYSELGDACVIDNLRHRGTEFARCVMTLELAQPNPSIEVLDAAVARLEDPIHLAGDADDVPAWRDQ